MFKQLNKEAVAGLVAATIFGTGWFLIRLVTAKATGQLDWTILFYILQLGVYGAMAIAPLYTKNPFRFLVTLVGVNILISAPIHYQVFSFTFKYSMANTSWIWACVDPLVFLGEMITLACWVGYLWRTYADQFLTAPAS